MKLKKTFIISKWTRLISSYLYKAIVNDAYLAICVGNLHIENREHFCENEMFTSQRKDSIKQLNICHMNMIVGRTYSLSCERTVNIRYQND